MTSTSRLSNYIAEYFCVFTSTVFLALFSLSGSLEEYKGGGREGERGEEEEKQGKKSKKGVERRKGRE